jgi:hypothetical protein
METMTRFGRPGRWKDLFGAVMVALVLLLLGIQAAPVAEAMERSEAGDPELECPAVECTVVDGTTTTDEVGTIRI